MGAFSSMASYAQLFLLWLVFLHEASFRHHVTRATRLSKKTWSIAFSSDMEEPMANHSDTTEGWSLMENITSVPDATGDFDTIGSVSSRRTNAAVLQDEEKIKQLTEEIERLKRQLQRDADAPTGASAVGGQSSNSAKRSMWGGIKQWVLQPIHKCPADVVEDECNNLDGCCYYPYDGTGVDGCLPCSGPPEDTVIWHLMTKLVSSNSPQKSTRVYLKEFASHPDALMWNTIRKWVSQPRTKCPAYEDECHMKNGCCWHDHDGTDVDGCLPCPAYTESDKQILLDSWSKLVDVMLPAVVIAGVIYFGDVSIAYKEAPQDELVKEFLKAVMMELGEWTIGGFVPMPVKLSADAIRFGINAQFARLVRRRVFVHAYDVSRAIDHVIDYFPQVAKALRLQQILKVVKKTPLLHALIWAVKQLRYSISPAEMAQAIVRVMRVEWKEVLAYGI